MDDTPHLLSHETGGTPPPLAADDFNPSQYYVVQISEYEAMKTEIERLRVAGNLLAAALRAETINGQMAVCDGTHEALDAWEARRG